MRGKTLIRNVGIGLVSISTYAILPENTNFLERFAIALGAGVITGVALVEFGLRDKCKK